MTAPLPSPARADRRQRSQNAAAVFPHSPAAAPSVPIGVFALKAIAHIPVPKVVKS